MTKPAGVDLHIGDLGRHADDEGEVGEVQVVGFDISIGEDEPAGDGRSVRSPALMVVEMRVVQREDRVEDGPREHDRDEGEKDVRDELLAGEIFRAREQIGDRGKAGVRGHDDEGEDQSAADGLQGGQPHDHAGLCGDDARPGQPEQAKGVSVPRGDEMRAPLQVPLQREEHERGEDE